MEISRRQDKYDIFEKNKMIYAKSEVPILRLGNYSGCHDSIPLSIGTSVWSLNFGPYPP